MSVSRAITIEGLEEMHDMFMRVLPRETIAILRKTANNQADKLRDKLRAAAPRDTGNLAQAIVSRAARTKNNRPMALVIVSSGKSAEHDAYYWRFLEYGTQAMPGGKPFIHRTVEANRAGVVAAYAQDMRSNLAKKMAANAKKAKVA